MSKYNHVHRPIQHLSKFGFCSKKREEMHRSQNKSHEQINDCIRDSLKNIEYNLGIIHGMIDNNQIVDKNHLQMIEKSMNDIKWDHTELLQIGENEKKSYQNEINQLKTNIRVLIFITGAVTAGLLFQYNK